MNFLSDAIKHNDMGLLQWALNNGKYSQITPGVLSQAFTNKRNDFFGVLVRHIEKKGKMECGISEEDFQRVMDWASNYK